MRGQGTERCGESQDGIWHTYPYAQSLAKLAGTTLFTYVLQQWRSNLEQKMNFFLSSLYYFTTFIDSEAHIRLSIHFLERQLTVSNKLDNRYINIITPCVLKLLTYGN